MKIRTECPKNKKYYIRIATGGYNGAVAGKPTQSYANVLDNCVGYANGRFNEIGEYGKCKYQLVCDAEDFIEAAKKMGLKISSTPIEGGIMVWQKGATLSSSDGAGHVAVVERVYDDGTIMTSESGWNAWAFKTVRRDNTNGRWGQISAYKFRGCIINPAVKNPMVVPVPPLTVDGVGGACTVRAMQRFFGTLQDGVLSGQNKACAKYYPALKAAEYGKGGSTCVKKLQKWLSISEDGVWGEKTSKALQKKLGVTADGIFGTKSMKAWQKYLNEHEKAVYPRPSVSTTPADSMQVWFDAMTTQYNWSKKQEYKFVTPTVKTSKNYGTCITFVAVSLQRLGLLPSGKYFYFYPKTKKIAGSGADYAKEHTELFQISYPNKTITKLWNEGKIKKGDIVGFGNPAYHTMVFMGFNSKNEPIFNTMGHKKGLGVTYSSYAKRKVNMLVHLKKTGK